MYTIIYFSPTGNAFYLAKKLACLLKVQDSKLIPLEHIEMTNLPKNNHLILVYAIHGFNAPRTVKRFVKALPDDLFEKVSLIGVGCNNLWLNDAVSNDLRKQFVKKGYSIMQDKILAMPLTFVLSFPNELCSKLIKESDEKIDIISRAIIKDDVTIKNISFKSKIVNFIGKGEQFAARFFGLELHADKKCNSCGICWENCPEKNIAKNIKGKPKFKFSCLMCMRCIYNCPQQAISPRISKFLTIKKGYSIDKYI